MGHSGPRSQARVCGAKTPKHMLATVDDEPGQEMRLCGLPYLQLLALETLARFAR